MSYRLFLVVAVGLACISLAACEQETDVFSIEVGDCFQDASSLSEEEATEVESVPIVDCEEHHDNEVYHTFDIEGGEFPGAAAVQETSDEGCLAAFEEFVGTPYDSSRYYFGTLYPTRQTWSEMDDREVVCYVFLPDGVRSQGSARGSGV